MAFRHSLLVGLVAIAPHAAAAFAVLNSGRPDDLSVPVEDVLRAAPRWSLDERVAPSLGDGLQVLVHPAVEEDLGAETPEQVELVRQAIRNAFAAWENDVLRFEITFDAAGTIRGEELGGEIDVFTVPGFEEPFLSNPTTFGFGSIAAHSLPGRLLTNGQRMDGRVITRAEIELNATLLVQVQADFGLSDELAALALTRLVMHEVGHTIGLGHPNEQRNFDTDFLPGTGAVVDPRDPFAGILDSPNFLQVAIMSNEPCGGPFGSTGLCTALVFQSLQNDDRLGRDVLYPVPEPAAAHAAALLAVAVLAVHRGGPRC